MRVYDPTCGRYFETFPDRMEDIGDYWATQSPQTGEVFAVAKGTGLSVPVTHLSEDVRERLTTLNQVWNYEGLHEDAGSSEHIKISELVHGTF